MSDMRTGGEGGERGWFDTNGRQFPPPRARGARAPAACVNGTCAQVLARCSCKRPLPRTGSLRLRVGSGPQPKGLETPAAVAPNVAPPVSFPQKHRGGVKLVLFNVPCACTRYKTPSGIKAASTVQTKEYSRAKATGGIVWAPDPNLGRGGRGVAGQGRRAAPGLLCTALRSSSTVAASTLRGFQPSQYRQSSVYGRSL